MDNYFPAFVENFKPALTPEGKGKSFYDLVIWVHNKQSILESSLVSVFNDSDLLKPASDIHRTWFGHIREIRDYINHSGARAAVFGNPEDGVLFQIHKEYFKNDIPSLPHIQYNETGVVYFRKYFALLFSNLLNFTEKLSEAIIQKYHLKPTIISFSDFTVVHSWIQDFYNELNR